MSVLFTFFDAVFGPLMHIGSRTTGALLTILVLNIVWALLLALIYKFLMNQKESKHLKGNIKELRKKVNEAKKNNDIKKMNEYMKKSMEYNNKLLKMSLKPMLVSFILVFLVFPWVHHTFNPEIPFQDINDTWQGDLTYDNLNVTLILNKTTDKVNFTGYGEAGKRDYVQIEDTRWQVKSIEYSKDGKQIKSRVALVFINLPFYLPLIERSIEWFGYYFLIGLPFTYLFRKLLKVT